MDLDGQEVALLAVAALTTAAVAYQMTRPSPPALQYSLTSQSRILPGPERIRVSAFLREGEPLLSSLNGAHTLYEGFQLGVKLAGDGNCLGSRTTKEEPYTWLSYNKVKELSHAVGCGLMKLGLQPHDNVGIYAINRTEWSLVEHGCNAFSLVTVPLYDTLGPEVVEYISAQTGMSTVACEPTKVKVILATAQKVKSIKTIIKFGQVTSEELTAGGSVGVHVVSLDDVIELGKSNLIAAIPPKPTDVATICYTSGTTGMPKGAILSHRNFLAGAAAAARLIDEAMPITKDDVHVSYLPLAHVFERAVQAFLFTRGVQIAFFRGIVLELMDDLKAVRPTFFPSVPRLLNRLHDKVLAGVEGAGAVSKIIFKQALASKKAEVVRGVIRNTTIWDKIVFKKIQAQLGGRVRLVITGAAPISKDVLTFLRAVLGCNVLEGYGQTESCAVSSVTLPYDVVPGTVGPPSPCNEIKLADVPEMSYFAKDDKGEICFRGPNVFLGYLNNDEKTREAIDSDGWLHSGDIGTWNAAGTLTIIDRKKNIFKLAQGEYIAPEKIENVYTQHAAIAQAFVYGHSLESTLVAVFFPDKIPFEEWAAARGFTEKFEQLCGSENVKKALLEELVKLGSSKGLKGFEQVKGIHLHPELMSVENNLLTPTFKAKRTDVEKVFKPVITQLYEKINKSAPSA